MMKHRKQKIVAYIIRKQGSERELLSFTHRDYPEAGIQVPAGTVDPGEKPEQTLFREVYEESGLDIKQESYQLLGIFQWERYDRHEIHQRFVYQINLKQDTADQWTHSVSGQGEDESLVFNYQWIKVSADLKKKLAANQGDYLEQLV